MYQYTFQYNNIWHNYCKNKMVQFFCIDKGCRDTSAPTKVYNTDKYAQLNIQALYLKNNTAPMSAPHSENRGYACDITSLFSC